VKGNEDNGSSALVVDPTPCETHASSEYARYKHRSNSFTDLKADAKRPMRFVFFGEVESYGMFCAMGPLHNICINFCS